jgi:hypothetical protein
MMNTNDRGNLNFLLTASKETLQQWYNDIDSKDLVYAMQLLDRYAEELNVRDSLTGMDAALATLCDLTDDPYAEANAVLAKFKLNRSL